jgi:lipopolysaccharide transport system ATP-binding protein
MAGEVLVKVEGVSKKFCKDLKTSLWYGVKDLFSGLRGNQEDGILRPKEFWAVRDINFELRRGECLGLIGHNGAGKSTLLKILNGLINPDAGTVTMRGRVSALIELGAGFNPILTGRENIYNNGAVLGFTRKEIDAKVEAIIDFSEIREFIDMPVQNYSSGMKVRLGFAVAAQMEPDILIIDEVLAVGDLGFFFKCLNKIGELIPRTAIIYVSHNMPQVSRICTTVLLMDKGQSLFYSHLVNEGINRYTHSFKNSNFQELGTGEITLKNIWMNDENSEKCESNIFLNGSNLSLNFELKINQSSIESFFIIVKIYDQQFREAINSFSHLNNDFIHLKSGTLKVNVILDRLYLNQGKHFVSISAESKTSRKVYCHATNALSFDVDDVHCGFATSTFPGKWHVN